MVSKSKYLERAQSGNEPEIIPVVGIGASAGGLKPLQAFFDVIPVQTGMAFVIITHLSPKYPSALDQLIAKHTVMPVTMVEDTIRIEPDHVYVIPAQKILSIENNRLISKTIQGKTQKNGIIDHFFKSLARSIKNKSTAVLLSGTGSDGSIGIKEIKEHGGVVLIQEPEEAEFGGMPLNAIRTKCTDFVLPVKKLAGKVLELNTALNDIKIIDGEDSISESNADILDEIYLKLKTHTGHDFSHYKRSTFLRRLLRRMRLNKTDNLSAYLAFLKQHPKETDTLFKDLLISVTNFFRNPEAYQQLEKIVLPKLFDGKNADDEIRIWVAGCATGEEAYSLAILFHEYSLKIKDPPSIQIIASDIDYEALSMGRKGIYPENIAADITPKRLARYFIKIDNGYKVRDELQRMILFAEHDLNQNPPFSKLDLIACRNLLIYFDRELQAEVFNLFHYVLRPNGYLYLGMSESVHEELKLFRVIDKKLGIYTKNNSIKSIIPYTSIWKATQMGKLAFPFMSEKNELVNFGNLHNRLLARMYGPPSVIINSDYQVVHMSKGIEQYLQYAEGEPTKNIIDMVAPDFKRSLKSMLFHINKQSMDRPLIRQFRVGKGETEKNFQISIIPVNEISINNHFYLIIFRELKSERDKDLSLSNSKRAFNLDASNEYIEQLEYELQITKAQLQTKIEEYETSNEELRASNEELQSVNEELQSTTEELETSKEELQSVNEELLQVNQQLENKISELKNTNDDLKNIMESSEVATILVNRKLIIRRFTSNLKVLFNILPTDVGRPFHHITHHLDYDDLIDDIRKVLTDKKQIKKIKSGNNNWYTIQMVPYFVDELVDGVVITFVDITQIKTVEKTLEERNRQQTALAELGMLVIQEKDLQIIFDKTVQTLNQTLNGDYCIFLEYNSDTKTALLKSAIGFPKDKIGTYRMKSGHGWGIDFVLKTNDIIIIHNFKDEKRFKLSPLVSRRKITSGISVIIGSTKNPLGTISLLTKNQREFSKFDLNFLQLAANIMTNVIERNKYLNQLREAKQTLEMQIDEQNRLQQEILDISEKERWNVAQYLHDDLGQTIIATRLLVRDVVDKLKIEDPNISSEIENIKELIDNLSSSIRALSHRITPLEIRSGDVEIAFSKLANNSAKLYGVQCAIDIDSKIIMLPDHKITTNLYYIAQEAIKNAVIHGKADVIKMKLLLKNNHIVMQVEDNGLGYSIKNDEKAKHGMGINIMRYRAGLINGIVHIYRQTGHEGSVVECIIPIPK